MNPAQCPTPTLATMSARSRSESLGSPLQKIAMGLVIVLLQAPFPPNPSPSWQRYDVLPNPLGWALVLAGTFALTRANPVFAPTRWMAGVAGVVSVPLWFPQVPHGLDESGQWAASLPQIVFCLWLAREIGVQGAQQEPPDDYAPKRFGLLVWGFGALALLPVLALGGGLDAPGLHDAGALGGGQPRLRLLPVPGAPPHLARRSGSVGDPSAAARDAREPPALELRCGRSRWRSVRQAVRRRRR